MQTRMLIDAASTATGDVPYSPSSIIAMASW